MMVFINYGGYNDMVELLVNVIIFGIEIGKLVCMGYKIIIFVFND